MAYARAYLECWAEGAVAGAASGPCVDAGCGRFALCIPALHECHEMCF